MRLDQHIASSSELSRKDARRAVMGGRVSVNGTRCKSARAQVSEHDQVMLDDRLLTLPGDLYLMMNKPAGVISATRDSNQPTALDLLPADMARHVHIAGRLDKDTTGLLLLTSDGQWSHQITSPRRDCPKTYQIRLAEPLSEDARLRLAQGVLLNGEDKPTQPARVVVSSETTIEMTIREGRYHQVKRMLAAVGNHVEALHRLSIGSIVLDDTLTPGQYRALTAEEVDSVREPG
ncbi:pseudouridine synthase [Marinobacter halophilus]|uniref:Pseudouridine synthase n=1 Tax=Marinobacter halophilus TaxID=1323740 RepID=A0A2T1KFI8_9GAMM|nr:pseudouridine synthase [Marinobacter halophilus]PSF08820.1 16S rRNA pseudouridine(516) synthase [Marinobacter halophilus]GGC64175.1 ribosomal small subunit pseudouridine synthase A [Marinobacter halophilus]